MQWFPLAFYVHMPLIIFLWFIRFRCDFSPLGQTSALTLTGSSIRSCWPAGGGCLYRQILGWQSLVICLAGCITSRRGCLIFMPNPLLLFLLSPKFFLHLAVLKFGRNFLEWSSPGRHFSFGFLLLLKLFLIRAFSYTTERLGANQKRSCSFPGKCISSCDPAILAYFISSVSHTNFESVTWEISSCLTKRFNLAAISFIY